MKQKTFITGLILMIVISLFAFFAYAQGGVTVSLVTTFNSPNNGDWVKSGPFNLTFVPSGNTSSTGGYNCSLFANFNGSWASQFSGGLSLANVTNIIDSAAQNFTIAQGALKDNNTGYTWNVGCVNNQTGNASDFPNSNLSFSFATNSTFRLDNTPPTVPVIDFPRNGSVIGSLNPFVNWSVTTETNFLDYRVQISNDSDFEASDILYQQILSSNVGTNSTNFNQAIAGEKFYFLRVLAEDSAGNNAWQFVNFTVVREAPTISITNFPNGSYSNAATPNFSIIVTSRFLDRVLLYLSNGTNGTFTTNETSWAINLTNSSRTNGSMSFNINSLTPMRNGTYLYSFVANNTGGNSSGFTVNRTIIIDSQPPEVFGCISINNSKGTNHRPEFVWNVSTDIGFGPFITFANYSITVDNNSDFSSPEITDFIYSQANNSYRTNVRPYNQSDREWFFKINASDKAGNTRVASNCSNSGVFSYRTDITNHFLPSGWNVVAIVQSGTINASDIGIGLGDSFNIISRFNSSKAFVSYTNGTSTNNGMSFKKGDVVFINLNAGTYWENQTWDTTQGYNSQSLFNLTNVSNGWNIFGVQNQSGFTIGRIELGIMLSNSIQSNGDGNSGSNYYYNLTNATIVLNDSIQYMDYYNNTAASNKKYVPHAFNYTFNNNTFVDYGESVWIQINRTGNSSIFVLNMSQIQSS